MAKKKVRFKAINEWPKTSDKEFSKRMFIIFMWAFFAHCIETLCAECFLHADGVAVQILQMAIPIYTAVFTAVIAKSGIENVCKGLSFEDDEPSNG